LCEVAREAAWRANSDIPEFGAHGSMPRTYLKVVEALLTAAASYEMVRAVGTGFDIEGWRLAANAIRLVEAEGRPDGRAPNSYFVGLYRSLADALASGTGFLFGLEGREHTAQVDQTRRQWREWRFRWGTEDRQSLAEAKDEMRQVGEPGVSLPALFCSPTMELGVDISALNAVYLRNMPPTPGQLCAAIGPGGTVGPSGAGGRLLLGAGSARPVLFSAARSDGKRHRAAAGARTGESGSRSGPFARGLACGIR
jgi:hypothetical protein